MSPEDGPVMKVIEIDFDSEGLDLGFQTIQQYLNTPADGSDRGAPTPSDSEEGKQKGGAGGADQPDGAEREPIVISTSITSQHVKELYERLSSRSYSAYDIFPEWVYTNATTENGLPGFTVLLRLKSKVNDSTIREFDPGYSFPTKKLAKELSANLAFEYLKEIPYEVVQLPKVEPGAGSDEPQDSENWVGLLQGFCQARGSLPQYIFYQPPTRHCQTSCEVSGVPPIQTMVFGSKTVYYLRRKAAKVQAAKAAMLYLNENPQPLPPKAPKLGKGGAFVGRVPLAAPGSAIKVPAAMGAVEKVTRVCPQLGLSLPVYTFYQDESASSLFDVTAIIKRGDGRKNVLFGKLYGKLGKKNAKADMAVSIFRWLHTEAAQHQVTIELEGSLADT